MNISIITPTFNSAKTLSMTIESILNQTHADIEHIIVDGQSTDSTLDIISSYKDKSHITLISEKDDGLYDAMNKGIACASGDIVGILNSDDFYYDTKVLEDVSKVFESHPDIDLVYGDLQYVSKNDISKINRIWRAGEYTPSNFRAGWMIPHPTLFVRKKVYEENTRPFNTHFKFVADYELMLRLLLKQNRKTFYIPRFLVKMRDGGASDQGLSQRIQGWKELKKAWEMNLLKVPPFFITRRIIGKIRQLFVLNSDK